MLSLGFIIRQYLRLALRLLGVPLACLNQCVCLFHQRGNVTTDLAFTEFLNQAGKPVYNPVEEAVDAVIGRYGTIQDPVEQVFHGPGQFANAGGAHESAAALERMEGAAYLGERFPVLGIVPETGVLFAYGLEDLVRLLDKDLQDLIVDQIGITFFGLGRGCLGLFGFWRLAGLGFCPGGLLTGREAETFKSLLRHSDDGIVILDTVHQTFQVVFNAGDGIRQCIQLFPARNIGLVEQYVLDETLAGSDNGSCALQRDQVEAAPDAEKQFGYALDFFLIPLGGNEIDHPGLDLLQRIARFAQYGGARL